MRIAIVVIAYSLVASVAHADEAPAADDYYSRARGAGIFHNSRLVAGVLTGDTLDGATTMGSLAFEASALRFPSSFGNFHGVEGGFGFRAAPFDLWAQLGTAITVLNLGRGGPLSFRLGGGFGAGFNLAHAFAYVRGRAAVVIVPRRVDAEVSVQWTPPSASSKDYDERTARISLWFRPGSSRRAYEVYVESFHRVDETAERDRELAHGLGGGIGVSLF